MPVFPPSPSPAPAPAIAYTTDPYPPSSYITPDEYKQAPTGVDVATLVPGGTQAAEDAALAAVIARASSWADSICDQILAATVDTENGRVRANRDGDIVVHPANWPVLEVRDFQYGPTPLSMAALADFSNVFVERQLFTVSLPLLGSLVSSAGPLQLGAILPERELFARWTYVNGWPNTVLAAPTTPNANQIVVGDATGVHVNQTRLTIYDPAGYERGLLVTDVAGTVLTVDRGLSVAHSAGASVSALPPAVKEAVILLTSALIKTRGAGAITLSDLTHPGHVQAVEGIAEEDVADAVVLLDRFRRIR